MWYSHTIEYIIQQRSRVVIPATTRTNLENIVLHERRKLHKEGWNIQWGEDSLFNKHVGKIKQIYAKNETKPPSFLHHIQE